MCTGASLRPLRLGGLLSVQFGALSCCVCDPGSFLRLAPAACDIRPCMCAVHDQPCWCMAYNCRGSGTSRWSVRAGPRSWTRTGRRGGRLRRWPMCAMRMWTPCSNPCRMGRRCDRITTFYESVVRHCAVYMLHCELQCLWSLVGRGLSKRWRSLNMPTSPPNTSLHVAAVTCTPDKTALAAGCPIPCPPVVAAVCRADA